MASSSSTKLTMKLLIDTEREKVLFAEASKAVVDFLFNLLCLPLGTIIRLLNKYAMVGCVGNLYESVESLDETYMQPNQSKNVLLKPRASIISSAEISGLLPSNYRDDHPNNISRFYRCSDHYGYVTCNNQTRCPHQRYNDGYEEYGGNSICNKFMSTEMVCVGEKPAEENHVFPNENGFVKEVVTYMVMDDLVIQPMSTISSITLLNKFNIKEVGALQEKVVELGMTQGVDMLKASLQSKMVLTSVFLKNNKPT